MLGNEHLHDFACVFENGNLKFVEFLSGGRSRGGGIWGNTKDF